VALGVSREIMREVLGPVLSPFGSLAMITLMGWICSKYSSLWWHCIVRRLFHSCSPYSHRGTRCLSSFSEYCNGLYCCRTILSYSFAPSCPCSEGRFSWRPLSTALDAYRTLVAMALSWCRDSRRSNSSPDMLLASLRMRRVGSLRGLDSSASCGQWLNRDSRRWTWAWFVNPRSVSLFMTRVSCSIPLCVALSRMGDRSRPVSFRSLYALGGKVGE
jgi:hypothetical protein